MTTFNRNEHVLAIYYPESFNREMLKFKIYVEKDSSLDVLKLMKNKKGKQSIIIRELIKKYNRHMEQKFASEQPAEIQQLKEEDNPEETNES